MAYGFNTVLKKALKWENNKTSCESIMREIRKIEIIITIINK